METMIKTSSSRRLLRHLRSSTALAMVLALALAPASAQSLPQGGSVAAGRATIGAPTHQNLTITQTSPAAVINWNAYSIGGPNSVTYVQPNASSAILNRVTSGTPTTIAGRLNANGQVYLVNPNGIAITSTGAVNVGGGFVASTLGISDSDFMAGKRGFTGSGHSASVSNAGTINAGSGGFVGLLGGSVSNEGTITVPLGKVGLGSGEATTLDLSGDGFMQVAVPTAAKSRDGKALVDVAGRITARGGRIELQAATVKQAIRESVNVSGMLSARSVSGHSGAIILGGGEGGGVTVSGRLDTSAGSRPFRSATRERASLARSARATRAPSDGGLIAITGDQVAIAAGASLKASSKGARGGAITVTGTNVAVGAATLDASGATGGGTILVGGGFQGGGPLAHARTLAIASGATLTADATQDGNGGQIVAWSDESTTVAGSLTARGAGLGNGGTIETSGHLLDVAGIGIDASAPIGTGGTWLLDPANINITTADFDYTPSGTNPVTLTSYGAANSTIAASTITGLLNAGTSVILVTGFPGSSLGDIVVSSPVTKTAGGAASLTLQAYGSINVSAAISSTVGALGVTLDANTGGAGGYVYIAAPITTLGGNLIIGGGATPLTSPAVGTSVSATGVFITTGSSLSAGGGNITINGQGFGATGYGINAGAAISTTGAGSITMSGTTSAVANAAFGMTTSNANITSGTGNISLSGTVNAAAVGQNVGFWLQSNTISTGGSGTIAIVGTTYGNATSPSYGVIDAGGGIVTAVNGLISITGTSNSVGTGSGNHGVYVTGTGSTIKSTGTGGLTIIGKGGGTGAGGGDHGVVWDVANAIQSTSTGAITISGTAGDGGGSGLGNFGVNMGSAIAAGGGAISMTGTGGNSSGTANYGFYQTSGSSLSTTGAGSITLSGTGGTGSNSQGLVSLGSVTTGTGNIMLTGGLAAAATQGFGINLQSGTVTTGGSGTITVAATTGTAAGAASVATFVANVTVTAANGLISMTGTNTSASTAASNHGVYITTGAIVRSTGTGGITVLGYGGGTGAGGSNYGVTWDVANAIQSTSTGPITMTGTGGGGATDTGGSNYGVYIGAALSITGTAALSISGTGGSLTGSTGNVNAGVYSIAALTGAGGPISITGTGGGGSGLTNYGIYQVTGGSVTNSGNISLSGTGGGTGNLELGVAILSSLSVGGGALSITGASSATATGGTDFGVQFFGGSATATGAGTITISGTGITTGTGSNSAAVRLENGSIITAVDGLISVTAHNNATATGVGNNGVYVTGAGSTIKSTGTGGVSITGFGGGRGAGGSNYGVFWDTANAIQSTSTGAISITGTGGGGGDRYGRFQLRCLRQRRAVHDRRRSAHDQRHRWRRWRQRRLQHRRHGRLGVERRRWCTRHHRDRREFERFPELWHQSDRDDFQQWVGQHHAQWRRCRNGQPKYRRVLQRQHNGYFRQYLDHRFVQRNGNWPLRQRYRDRRRGQHDRLRPDHAHRDGERRCSVQYCGGCPDSGWWQRHRGQRPDQRHRHQ